MIYRTLLVDDEPLARHRLVRLLAAHVDVAVVGEAGTGGEAVEAIRTLRPDLVFLDIHLPSFDGFDVLRQSEDPPLVIFTTAHENYALQAFQAAGIDYLLKPVEAETLARAILKLRRLTQGAREHLAQRLQEVVSELRPPAAAEHVRKLAVRVGDRAFLIDMSHVTHFEAKDKYVFLYTGDGKEHIVDYTLADLEARLDAHTFVRIHRSTIVNIDHVREIQTWFDGKYHVVLDDAARTELLVSKGMAPRLKALVSL